MSYVPHDMERLAEVGPIGAIIAGCMFAGRMEANRFPAERRTRPAAALAAFAAISRELVEKI